MEFDIVGFLTQGVDNAPIVLFTVLAFTYIAGEFGLKGKAQLAFALVLGFSLGFGLQAATFPIPEGFGGWYWFTVYAMLMAVIPSLLYDQAKDLIEKALTSVISQG